jgi:hypothetical protein
MCGGPSFPGLPMRKYRLPLIYAALATLVIVAAVVAFFVPTAIALGLIAVAAVLIAVGGVAFARQL